MKTFIFKLWSKNKLINASRWFQICLISSMKIQYRNNEPLDFENDKFRKHITVGTLKEQFYFNQNNALGKLKIVF